MKKPARCAIDVESLSHQSIVDLLKELHGTSHNELALSLQRELVRRLKVRGMDTQEIIRRLAYAVPRGHKLNEIANDWAAVLGIAVSEFKRIADAK